MIVLWGIYKRSVKRREEWPEPDYSFNKASTKVAQPSNTVISNSHLVTGSSRVNGIQRELVGKL